MNVNSIIGVFIGLTLVTTFGSANLIQQANAMTKHELTEDRKDNGSTFGPVLKLSTNGTID